MQDFELSKEMARLISASDIAKRCGVTHRVVMNWARAGKITPIYRHAALTLFLPQHVSMSLETISKGKYASKFRHACQATDPVKQGHSRPEPVLTGREEAVCAVIDELRAEVAKLRTKLFVMQTRGLSD